MRALVVVGLVAGLGVLLQTTLPHALPSGWQFSPDLLVVLGVFLGLHRHTVGGALAAFVLGYVQDAVSGGVAGANAFGMVVVYALVYLTCRRLWVDNALSKIVLVLLASLVKSVAVLVVSFVFGAFDGAWGPALGRALATAALAAAVAPAVFALLDSAHLPEERDEP